MNKPQNEESDSENPSSFLINRSGFPLDDHTWGRMWDYAAKHHTDGYGMVSKIRTAKHLDHVAMSVAPVKIPVSVSVPQRMQIIQNYMSSLQYNHTGTQLFDIKKSRPISGLMDVARDMIRESLPIKCLEALILAIYLTNDIEAMERFAISFKTSFSGVAHRHVVLGVYCAGAFGCLGMSRRSDLMFKPLQYKTLADLIFEFIEKYSSYSHDVKKVKIGLPVPHDPHSHECIQWKALVLNKPKMSETEMRTELEKTARTIKSNVRNVWLPSPQRTCHTVGESARSSIGRRSRESSPTKFICKDRSPNRKLNSRNNHSDHIRI